MLNLQTLKTALETDPRYKAAVENGSNSTLLELLGEDHPTEKVGQTLSRDEVLEAIGPGLRALTGDALNRLRILTAGDTVDFSRQGVRDEVEAIFAADAGALTRIRNVAGRSKSNGEAAAGGQVTLRDLWKVLPQIPTSHHAKYLAEAL